MAGSAKLHTALRQGLFLGLGILFVGASHLLADEVDHSEYNRLFRIELKGRTDLIPKLIMKGFDIAGRNWARDTVDIIAHSPEESGEIVGLGANVKFSWAMDSKLAPASEYKNPAEIELILKSYAQTYPHLTELTSIGKSGEGRDIWALKITEKVKLKDRIKPTILFNGMHHAREVMTPEVVLDTAEQLLSLYQKDPQITHWVQANEIWLVPMVNPDGNHRVWTRNSMWRKNTRGGYGVDLNRNYPYGWGSCYGSSGSTGSDTYRGPSAASEPETRALMTLVENIQPVFDISYHSYSEMVLFPYSCDGEKVDAHDIVEPIGQAIAQALPSDTGTGTYVAGTSWELLYSVDGADLDWMYHDHHVIPFVIELNSDEQGFQPDYTWRQPTVEKLRAAWSLVLNRLDQSGVRGVVTSHDGSLISDVPLSVSAIDISRKISVLKTKTKKNGSFHVVLNPGHYEISFGEGDQRVTREILVGEHRVDLDVSLRSGDT